MNRSESVCDYEFHNAFLSAEVATPTPPMQLVVLNYILPSFIQKLWHRSSARIFGDGGANRFYDLLPQIQPSQDPVGVRLGYLPDVICGDLDSIRPEVMQFYRSQGVPVRDLSHDQDSTDAQKCIEYVREKCGRDLVQLCIVGSLGGRLDHTLSNLHTLHTYSDMEIVMIGEGNCARLIKEGKTKITVDPEVEGPNCALVPLNGPVTVTATGLQWPLHGHELRFDGLISTSNLMVSDVVIVVSSGPVLWITKLRESEILKSGP